MNEVIVGVTSRSFSRDERLRERCATRYKDFQFKFYSGDLSSESELSSFLRDCSVWLVGKEPVSSASLEKATDLKLICKYGVGLDNVDFQVLSAMGIGFHHEPGVNRNEVAEHTIGLMLSASRNITSSALLLKQGVWHKAGGSNLSGSTVAIIGCGSVGQSVATLCKYFGCSILLVDLEDRSRFASSIGAKQLSFTDAIMSADIVSMHVPLTDLTFRMINSQTLRLMKTTAIFVNTSRGEVVDELALINALVSEQIKCAALDVFCDEPHPSKDLISLDNCIGTPHIAGNSREAVWKMGCAALNGLQKIRVRSTKS